MNGFTSGLNEGERNGFIYSVWVGGKKRLAKVVWRGTRYNSLCDGWDC